MCCTWPKPALTKALTKVLARLAWALSSVGPLPPPVSTRCDLYTCENAHDMMSKATLRVSNACWLPGTCTPFDSSPCTSVVAADLLWCAGSHHIQVARQCQVALRDPHIRHDGLQCCPLLLVCHGCWALF
jgi:hypothetical protein